ncbi:MAG: hypothetical protein ACERKD_05610 [Prolixibacteraceae bacterium]
MSIKARNSIALSLMLLIIFSSIGFNIISTFCDGCAIEQTSIGLSVSEVELDCACCATDEVVEHCCSMENKHTEDHHKTKTTLAQLKFDSPAAKAKSVQVEAPLFLIHFISIVSNNKNSIFQQGIRITNNLAPPLSGRSILKLICILRN